MLEHNAENPVQQAADLRRNLYDPQVSLTRDAPRMHEATVSSLQEKWIEDYLDQIYAALVRSVPYRQRQEIRREMRAHIGQLIAAHEELGSDPEEATTASLRQFGQPDLVARKWLDELGIESYPTVGFEVSSDPPVSAFKYAAVRMAAGISLWTMSGIVLDREISGTVVPLFFIGVGAAVPITVGYLTGRRHALSRPILSALLAQAVTLPVWPFVMMSLMQALHSRQPEYTTALIMGSVSFLALAPFGCISAWFGARKSRARNRRARIAAN